MASMAEQPETSLLTFPNPAQHEVVIQGLKKGMHVSLVNSRGQGVFETRASNGTDLVVDLSSQPAGMYIVKCSNGWAERLIIVR